MDYGLRGKVAVVTGGSKGIGREVAKDLSSEGVRVVVAARGKAGVEDAVQEIESSGGQAIGVAVDATTQDGIRELCAYARAEFGPPDIAIFNVHGPVVHGFDASSDADFASAFNDLVMGLVWTVREVAPAMKERGWGRIVNINSIAAKQPHRGSMSLATANTTRVAAVGLAKTLSAELGRFGITINVVAPGATMTDRITGYYDEHPEHRYFDVDTGAVDPRRIPVGRLGDPKEIAGLVTFLCSVRAGFITGQTIVADGGQLAGIL